MKTSFFFFFTGFRAIQVTYFILFKFCWWFSGIGPLILRYWTMGTCCCLIISGCKIYSNIPYFILDIGDLYLLFLSALLMVYQFYQIFSKRTSFLFYWFFPIVFPVFHLVDFCPYLYYFLFSSAYFGFISSSFY